MSDTSPMMQQYERIKTRHSDAILFFRLGDFYEMFRSDALDASRILGLTLTQRQGVPMCGIPFHAVRTYIPRLLLAGKKIAICEQTQVNAKGLADRDVVQIITPGTLMDEEYLDRRSNNFLLSLSMPHPDRHAYALCDLSTGELEVGDYPASASLENLHVFLSKWPIQEVLIQESMVRSHPDLVKDVQERSSILLNRFGDWLYDTPECRRKLCGLLGLHNLKSFGLPDEDILLHPVSAVLFYGEDTSRHALNQIRGIHYQDSGQVLQLDETSIRNLELVRNSQDGGTAFSLLKLLDETKTSMGSRLMRRWIVEPLADQPKIARRLDAVEHLYHQQLELSSLRERLGRLHDLERLSNRVLTDKAHPKDLQSLARSAAAMEDILQSLQGTPLFEDCEVVLEERTRLQAAAAELIESLAPDAPVNINEGGIIAPGRDPEIDRLRALQTDSESILEEYMAEERSLCGINSLKVKYNKIIGYFIEVSKSNLAQVPAHFIRRQSLVNGERFTTQRLSELEDAILNASEACIEREKDLFLRIREETKPFMPLIVRLSAFISRADVLASFAHTATTHGYVRPQLFDDHRLFIRGGRHPVVEQHIGIGNFIPNDCELATPRMPDRTALITGPNMAGKSTYLRQQALIVLMAHMGCWVPAEEAHIGLCDRIFCRVGASDNLSRGESTFLVEMNEAAFILRQAGPRSLIIMDEVGRGTSTQDGLSIAQAILEHLVDQIRARCLFATHFHELTEGKGFVNLSMSVEELEGEVHFLKKVVSGPSSNSYGIHVAQLAGLPEQVVLRAKSLLAVLTAQVQASVKPAQTIIKPSKVAVVQQSLFSPEDALALEIQNLDLDNMTPLQALNYLSDLKKRQKTNRN